MVIIYKFSCIFNIFYFYFLGAKLFIDILKNEKLDQNFVKKS